jgi:tetratricopeptide (TPR) repeat protein
MTEREALAILRGSDPAAAARAEAQLWEMWCRASEPEIDALFAQGVMAMEQGRVPDAEAVFTRIIGRAPEFAEGWNKRATALYLAGQYQRSLSDCGEVLKRNPRHFGALSGAGLIHLELEQHRQALEWFRRALEVNPNMSGIEAEARRLEELLRGRST